MSLRLSLVAVALSAGCLAPTDDVELESTEQQIIRDDCSTWGCGTNSPVIDSIELHELHERGDYNSEDFRIAWFRKGSTYYQPDVIDGRLVGRYFGTLALTDVAGAEFRVTHRTSGKAYILAISGTAHRVPFWASADGTAQYALTYDIRWLHESEYSAPYAGPKPWRAVCGKATAEDSGSFRAVLFEGDRIDPRSKRIYANNNDWFNIGCAGHALAKQHLTGHTAAASRVLGITTTWDMRTANLKMLTADYCGTGVSFTSAGVPLHWRDSQGWYNSIIAFGDALEARWTASGPTCLNTPRLVASGEMTASEMSRWLGESCGTLPPTCVGTVLRGGNGEHIVSATP